MSLPQRDGGGASAVSSARASRADDAYDAARRAFDGGRVEEGLTLLESAADLGHAGAAYDLSKAYGGEDGVEPDLERRTHWLNEAAALGDPRARFVVGAALYAEQDQESKRKGLAYLESAADAGNARAEHVLGEAYAKGAGVERDPAWGMRWTARAATRGHSAAQRAYGIALMSGVGAPRDYEAAYVWLALAASGDEPSAARLRDVLAKRLDPKALARAEARVAAFRPVRQLPYSDGVTVAYVQGRLAALGIDPGPRDGLMGPRTTAAVRAYQKRTGLQADGEVDPALVASLRQAANG
jgi:localization factor PodJL